MTTEKITMTAEEARLAAARDGTSPWRRWGPYVSERQWGTVREDYSADGTPWEYFPHDHARSRAYRWGEDGIAGICDDRQRLCFAVALWNGADPILKERLFGLTGHEGNHGEDVKEYYFYLDNVPSHAYMKMLYKYPQRAYPYADLVEENRRRTRNDPEYELIDTGVFEGDRYFDVFVEYAKAAPDDILVRIRAVNRGPDAAPLHLLPTLWFRNDWSWYPDKPKPRIEIDRHDACGLVIKATSREGEVFRLYSEAPDAALFAENETNTVRHPGCVGTPEFGKDAFDRHVVHGIEEAVNPARRGTKAAPLFRRTVDAGEHCRIEAAARRGPCRSRILSAPISTPLFELPPARGRRVLRARDAVRIAGGHAQRAAAGVRRDAVDEAALSLFGASLARRRPASARRRPTRVSEGRNHEWPHFAASDILSMPDKWEYPWFAAWDTAFHVVALAMIDPDFAKDQLLLLMREWYMHPNGQIPAYEWAFGDVNPPVHAWAAIRVYQIEGKMYGRSDRAFLERAFQKLLHQLHVVGEPQGFRRQQHLRGRLPRPRQHRRVRPLVGTAVGRAPRAGRRHELDGDVLPQSAGDLARARARRIPSTRTSRPSSSSTSSTSAPRVNRVGDREGGLWHDEDGFYYDALKLPDGRCFPIRANTIAGLIPLLAIAVGERDSLRRYRGFAQRFRWFLEYRRDLLERSCRSHAPRHGRSAAPRPRRFGQAPAHPRASCSTRSELLEPARRAFAVEAARGRSVRPRARRPALRPRLRARRIDHAALRRQLELARAGVVSHQFPADRGAAEAPLFPRRRLQGANARRAPAAN